MTKRLLISAAAAAALLPLAPAAANAATAGTAQGDSGALLYAADRGEANRLTVSSEGGPFTETLDGTDTYAGRGFRRLPLRDPAPDQITCARPPSGEEGTWALID